MKTLTFAVFEGILYPYVHNGLRQDGFVKNETDFVFHLLYAADENTKPVKDKSKYAASRYKNGKRAIPKKIVATFHRRDAATIVTDYLDYLVVPYIESNKLESLIPEYINAIEADGNISGTYKEELLAKAQPETLAEFLSKLLIYAVSADAKTDALTEKQPSLIEAAKSEYLFGLPLCNDWFTGRRWELEQIEANTYGESNIQIICGPGGIGKTQLALQYAYEYGRNFSFVHWVDGRSEIAIVNCYRAFLQVRGLSVSGDADAVVGQYIQYMDSLEGWLIVYDGCDYFADDEYTAFLNRFLPKNANAGSIILTTSNRRQIGKAARTEVGRITAADAVAFLLGRTGLSDQESATELAERLGGYPLALEIAGAYIAATPSCDFQRYLSYLKKGYKVLNEKVELVNYDKTLTDVILLTLERIKVDRHCDMLSLCIQDVISMYSYGANNLIDLEYLAYLKLTDYERQKEPYRSRLRFIKEICTDEVKRDELSRLLVKYSLMTDTWSNGYLMMHEVQQEIIRNYISAGVGLGVMLNNAVMSYIQSRGGERHRYSILYCSLLSGALAKEFEKTDTSADGYAQWLKHAHIVLLSMYLLESLRVYLETNGCVLDEESLKLYEQYCTQDYAILLDYETTYYIALSQNEKFVHSYTISTIEALKSGIALMRPLIRCFSEACAFYRLLVKEIRRLLDLTLPSCTDENERAELYSCVKDYFDCLQDELPELLPEYPKAIMNWMNLPPDELEPKADASSPHLL